MSRRTLPLLLLLAAAVGCGGKPSPDTKPEPPPAPPPTTAAKPADPNAPTGDRTFTYWEGVWRLQEVTARRYAALADPKADEVKTLLTAAAKGIDELPTDTVDGDAVAVGKALADALRQGEAKSLTADAAGQARTTRAALSTRYGREFPALDWAAAKDPAFRLTHDLARPTAAQELARLKGEVAKLDAEIKPVNKELTDEITAKDKLQGEADAVRAILKEQTSDADLKKVREEVLADAVKQVEAKKKVIDELTKKVNALRGKRGEVDRLAFELAGVLTEGDPEKADKLSNNQLERLRVQAEKLTEKLAPPKK